jgi:hypothetical protein
MAVTPTVMEQERWLPAVAVHGAHAGAHGEIQRWIQVFHYYRANGSLLTADAGLGDLRVRQCGT